MKKKNQNEINFINVDEADDMRSMTLDYSNLVLKNIFNENLTFLFLQ